MGHGRYWRRYHDAGKYCISSLLSPVAFKIIKDYDRQRKVGLDSIFDPKTLGLEDENGVWDKYVEAKKKRGDYSNQALGYGESRK